MEACKESSLFTHLPDVASGSRRRKKYTTLGEGLKMGRGNRQIMQDSALLAILDDFCECLVWLSGIMAAVTWDTSAQTLWLAVSWCP